MLGKMHAAEKMAHAMRNLDIVLAIIKEDPMVMAHTHTSNK